MHGQLRCLFVDIDCPSGATGAQNEPLKVKKKDQRLFSGMFVKEGTGEGEAVVKGDRRYLKKKTLGCGAHYQELSF